MAIFKNTIFIITVIGLDMLLFFLDGFGIISTIPIWAYWAIYGVAYAAANIQLFAEYVQKIEMLS